MKKISLVCLLFILFTNTNSFAQINLTIDSLLTLIKTSKDDTNKVNNFVNLCNEYKEIENYDKGLQYGIAGVALGKKLNFQKGIAASYKSIGNIYYNEENYDKALENYFASLKIREEIRDEKGAASICNKIGNIYYFQGDYFLGMEFYLKSLHINEKIGDKQGIASAYNNIGNINDSKGEYAKAMEFYFKALKIREELLDKKGMASCYGNIGIMYKKKGDYDKGLEFYLKSLKMFEETGNKEGIGNSFNNIGIIYSSKGDYAKALDFHAKSLKIKEEIMNKQGMAESYNNIGNIHSFKRDYTKALEFQLKAMKIYEEIGYKQGITHSYNSIGSLHLQKNNLLESKRYQQKSLAVAKEIASLPDIMFAYEGLSKVDSALNNFKEAYEYQKLYKEMNDSIFNLESAEKTAEITAIYESEKKETQIKLLEKDKEKQTALAVVEKKKQLTILYSVVGGLFLVIVFAGFIYNRWRITRQQKVIIEQKEKETSLQKNQIEEKHKEITDSINYAERIQRSFLATTEMLDQNLKDYFVFFRPKDIVSGDFYWSGKLNNGNFAFSVADSTGHGVPGAIMSILNISSLEKSIEKETEPNLILNETRKIIIERLKKDGSVDGGKDGMDCSLLVLNQNRTQLTFAAANNPVFIVRNNELIEYKPDKMPVGKHYNDAESFTLHTTLLQKGDIIYALTDGFPDQFGGTKGKKYMIKNLKELLLKIAHLPVHEQELILSDEFTDWKGENEQVDDVCIIGVRV